MLSTLPWTWPTAVRTCPGVVGAGHTTHRVIGYTGPCVNGYRPSSQGGAISGSGVQTLTLEWARSDEWTPMKKKDGCGYNIDSA